MRLVSTLAVLLLSLLTWACGSNGTPAETPTTTGTGAGGTGGTTTSSTDQGGGGGAVSSGGPVSIDGVTNARHAGGLPTGDGMHVRDNTIIRSGHLAELGPNGCTDLQILSIQTVVDLRAADGTTGANTNPDDPCVTGALSYYQADLPKLVPPSADYYLQTLSAAEPKLGTIFGLLAQADGLPAILHCVIGRDRASLVTALVLLAVGVPSADVVDDFVTNQDGQISVDAAWLQAVIDHIDGQGGIESYLQQHGVTAQQLADLRAQALEP